MSLLDADTEFASEPSKRRITIFTVVIIVSLMISLSGASFGGYYYAKYEEATSKLTALQSNVSRQVDLSGQIQELDEKIDTMQGDIDHIKLDTDELQTDVHVIKTDVDSIESDVSSIQLKVGY